MLAKYVTGHAWLNLGNLNSIIDSFSREGIKKIVIAGLIRHENIYRKINFDKMTQELLKNIKDNRADSILGAVADKFAERGMELISAIDILKEHLAGKGALTRIAPDPKASGDILFGFDAAKHIAGLDIGQTVIVKDKAVVAVEAMEGTDRCILRSADIAGEGIVVVKVSKPRQDWRFDVPVVGMHTIEILHKVKAGALALEAGKTIMVDKEKIIQKADEYSLIVYGV